MLHDLWQILGTNFQRKLIRDTFLSLPLDDGLVLQTFCGRDDGRGVISLDEVAIARLAGGHVNGSVVSHVGWYGDEAGDVVGVKGKKSLRKAVD
jgi:hypothetical protein